MVNVSRQPGVWQSFDIVFTAPRFDKDGKILKPAYATVLHNGVLVQNHTEVLGNTHYDRPPAYHGNPVRFRNIWLREFKELEA